MTQTTETKTPYGSIFRSGDREWFPGSIEELRAAKCWEENQARQKASSSPNGDALIAKRDQRDRRKAEA